MSQSPQRDQTAPAQPEATSMTTTPAPTELHPDAVPPVEWRTASKTVYKLMEWRTAHNSAAYLLPTLQAMSRSTPALKILDVGAGSGSISASLAQILGPAAGNHVTALDINPETIPRCRAVAAEMGVLDRMAFVQGEAHNLPFGDASFDVVHCHQVLAHVSSPWDALREMLRVTKPGGVVAVREGDWETEIRWPALPGLVKFHGFAGSMLVGHGGTRTAGRQLVSWALRAGVQRTQITPSYGTWSYADPELKKIYAQGIIQDALHGRVREAGLKSGLTDEDFDEMEKDFQSWSEMEDGIIAMLHGEILIRK